VAIVTVYDKDGNPANVSEAWLAQWPNDFTRKKPVSKTAKAETKKPGGNSDKEAR
jgi:hypothetical protein